jgi:hypothetical protein
MTLGGRLGGPMLLLVGGVLAIGSLTVMEERARAAGPPPLPLPAVLSPHELKALAGGFAPALADINWIEGAAIAGKDLSGQGADHLFDLLDRVTVLDPAFEPAYHHGALLLSVAARRPDLSDRLLVRARAQFPDEWTFPFYLGFNALYHRTDFPEAARYMADAARLPGAPPYLPALAARLNDQAHDREVALDLVRRMLRATRDPLIHERLAERLKALEAGA